MELLELHIFLVLFRIKKRWVVLIGQIGVAAPLNLSVGVEAVWLVVSYVHGKGVGVRAAWGAWPMVAIAELIPATEISTK